MKKNFYAMLGAAAMLTAGINFNATAHDYTAGTLKIGHPWTRATPAGSTVAAGFFSVTNTGKTADKLVGAAFKGAKSVSIHESVTTPNGMMRMEPVKDGVTIAPGQTVILAPGGLHMMLEGLNKPLKAGDSVSATLAFAHGGIVPVEFKVEKLGATAPAHGTAPEGAKIMLNPGHGEMDHSSHH